ncbi:hypothetical protein [Croceimicrobium hydrocarbonivorans]|uniref:Uncharacterized protein n=1 Tax=Croceimicrobium hydrocarbonivorans TaxID=2761580 RepID=A0A7H0VB35_9FLAO|nr:hypothetical protein [Croceimicrobium hydrocarbonivorans]QNR22933.1 hypothetical protein H4K34_11145 [Croceimicrobium hydrocarbonivorans]
MSRVESVVHILNAEIKLHSSGKFYLLKELQSLGPDSIFHLALRKEHIPYEDLWQEQESGTIIDTLSLALVDSFLNSLEAKPLSFACYLDSMAYQSFMVDSIHELWQLKEEGSLLPQAYKRDPYKFEQLLLRPEFEFSQLIMVGILSQDGDTLWLESRSKLNFMLPWQLEAKVYYNPSISRSLFALLKALGAYPNRQVLSGRGTLINNYPEYYANQFLTEEN